MYFSYSVFHGNDFQILQPNQKYDLDKKGTIDFLETEIKTNELKEQNNTQTVLRLVSRTAQYKEVNVYYDSYGADGLISMCGGGGGEPF